MAIISYPALFFPPLTTITRNDRSPRQVVIFFCSIGPSQIAAALKRHTVMSYLRPNIFLVRNSDIVVFSVESKYVWRQLNLEKKIQQILTITSVVSKVLTVLILFNNITSFFFVNICINNCGHLKHIIH